MIGVMTIAENIWHTKLLLFLVYMFNNMRFPVFVTKIFIAFRTLRSCHAYISTITIFTLWGCLRHFCSYRCLILLINVSRYSLPEQIQVVSPNPASLTSLNLETKNKFALDVAHLTDCCLSTISLRSD
jgi:hypothetical protein